MLLRLVTVHSCAYHRQFSRANVKVAFLPGCGYWEFKKSFFLPRGTKGALTPLTCPTHPPTPQHRTLLLRGGGAEILQSLGTLNASPGSSAPFLQAGPAPSSARPLHPRGTPPPSREAFLCQQPLFSPALPGYGQHDQAWTSQPLLPSHGSLAAGGFGTCHFAPGATNISRQPSLVAAGKQQAPDRERESWGLGARRPKHKAPASLRSARRLLPEQAALLGPAPLLRGTPRSALPLQGILIAWLNLQGRQPGLREHGLLWKGKQNRARVGAALERSW